MFRRTCVLLLVLVLLLPVGMGCQKRVIDAEYQIVYAKDDLYAPFGAKALAKAIGGVLEKTPSVISAARFDPETAAGKTIFIGDTGHVADLPDMGEKAFSVDLADEGVQIRGENSLTLFLACKAVGDHWVTEEYGLVGEGELVINKKICKKLNELSVNTDAMLSVMSQNVRCADDGAGKTVAERKVRLKELVQDYSPDLIGTQEVTKEWMGIFSEYFGAAYGMVGCSRDGEGKESGEWNTILYRKERFDLVSSGTFWLTDTPNTISKLEGITYNRICTWAVLKDKVANIEIMLCNTHLDHQSDEARAKQAAYLMDFIKEHEGDYPIFLTGDFNTTSDKKAYKTVTAVLADSHKKAAADASSVKGTFHNYLAPSHEIDFCFFDDEKAEAMAYRIQSDDYKGFVSDHYGVIAYFQYK